MTHPSKRPSTVVLIGLTAALVGLGVGGPRTLAQDGTPPTGGAADSTYPAAIYRGSCAEFDPTPRFPLTGLTLPAANEGGEGSEAAVPAAMSVTTLEGQLDDLIAEPLALAVHEATADFGVGTPVACGEIGGVVVDGNLVIGLPEQNGSGYAGIAALRVDGDRIQVTVFVAQGLAGAASGTGASEATQATVAFYVETVTCPGCQRRVEGSIRKAPGILDVVWEGKTVTVTYDPGAVSPAEILAAIQAGGDSGYEVSVGA